MSPAHEPFDRLVAAVALRIYGRDGESPNLPLRWTFRLGLAASAILLGTILVRHGGLPAPWHRWAWALWLAAGTVALRGEAWRGQPWLSRLAALGLGLGVLAVLWLATR